MMPLVSGVIGQVQGDIICLGIQLVQGAHDFDAGGPGSGRVSRTGRGHSRTTFMPSVSGGVGHQHADGTQANHAQRLAHDLRADEVRTCPSRRRRPRPAPAADCSLHPRRCRRVMSREASSRAAMHQLLHGVGVGAGGVEDDDAGFGAPVQGDVVHASAGAGDGTAGSAGKS